MKNPTPSTPLRISAEVIHTSVGDEAVLLDLNSEMYFGLDPVGRRIWECLGEGKTLKEIASVLTAEYDVDENTALEDTAAFTQELLKNGLLEQAPKE